MAQRGEGFTVRDPQGLNLEGEPADKTGGTATPSACGPPRSGPLPPVDFEGFLLEVTCDEVVRFNSKERRVECLVREAWQQRSTVIVVSNAGDVHCPVTIVIGGAAGCC